MSQDETFLERIGAAGASVASLGGQQSRTQKLLMWAMGALIVAFLAAAIISQWSKLPDIHWRFEPGWLALCLAALITFQFIHATLWVFMLEALGAPIHAMRGRAVWSLTLLARYVPTNIALAVSHHNGTAFSVSALTTLRRGTIISANIGPLSRVISSSAQLYGDGTVRGSSAVLRGTLVSGPGRAEVD